MAKKILVAEDEKFMADAMEQKLKKEGLDVSVARDGEEALKLIEKKQFDLILLDLIMPVKDGFTVLKELKNKGIKVPILITSNLSQTEDVQKAKDLGAVDFIIKSETTILEIVNKVKELTKA